MDTKKNFKKIDVACSVSENEIKKVESWVIPSLLKQRGIESINLFLFNYTGEDNCVYKGEKHINNIKIIEINKGRQSGFGEAHNYVFDYIKPESYWMILNPDVFLHEDCIWEMMNKIEECSKYGIVEARQLPFEHPKEYDKISGETSWASGFCLLVRSDAFREVSGYDEGYWMYCEDVDLSWRLRMAGYKAIYCPEAVAYHFTGAFFEYNSSRYYLEHFWSSRNFLYLACKFFGKRGERKAKRLLNSTTYSENFKQEVLSSYEKVKSTIPLDFSRNNKKKIKECGLKIYGFNHYN